MHALENYLSWLMTKIVKMRAIFASSVNGRCSCDQFHGQIRARADRFAPTRERTEYRAFADGTAYESRHQTAFTVSIEAREGHNGHKSRGLAHTIRTATIRNVSD